MNSKDSPPTPPAPIAKARNSEFVHSSRRRDDLMPLHTPNFCNYVICRESLVTKLLGWGVMWAAVWFPCHVYLKSFLIISHCLHCLLTSITPALDMSRSQPPSQRHRTRLSRPIRPHKIGLWGLGDPHMGSPLESPSFLPLLHQMLLRVSPPAPLF